MVRPPRESIICLTPLASSTITLGSMVCWPDESRISPSGIFLGSMVCLPEDPRITQNDASSVRTSLLAGGLCGRFTTLVAFSLEEITSNGLPDGVFVWRIEGCPCSRWPTLPADSKLLDSMAVRSRASRAFAPGRASNPVPSEIFPVLIDERAADAASLENPSSARGSAKLSASSPTVNTVRIVIGSRFKR
jgi:hypothetical protein